jgi:hypothetical protein
VVFQGGSSSDAVDGVVGDAREHFAQVGFGIDAVEFGGADQPVDSAYSPLLTQEFPGPFQLCRLALAALSIGTMLFHHFVVNAHQQKMALPTVLP